MCRATGRGGRGDESLLHFAPEGQRAGLPRALRSAVVDTRQHLGVAAFECLGAPALPVRDDYATRILWIAAFFVTTRDPRVEEVGVVDLIRTDGSPAVSGRIATTILVTAAFDRAERVETRLERKARRGGVRGERSCHQGLC